MLPGRVVLIKKVKTLLNDICIYFRVSNYSFTIDNNVHINPSPPSAA